MNENPIELIDDILNILKAEHNNGNDMNKDNQLTQWIMAQLKNLIFELEAIKMDLESGLTMSEVGFFSLDDLKERLDEYKIQIDNLKSAMRNFIEIS